MEDIKLSKEDFLVQKTIDFIKTNKERLYLLSYNNRDSIYSYNIYNVYIYLNSNEFTLEVTNSMNQTSIVSRISVDDYKEIFTLLNDNNYYESAIDNVFATIA